MFRWFFRWLLIGNWLSRLVRNQILEMIVPALVGLYFLVLDVWGDDLWWVRDYQDTHKVIFGLFAGATIAILFWRGIGDFFFGSQSEYVQGLENLLYSIERIISAKIRRFQLKSREVRANTNVFTLITQPDEQIRVILEEAHGFLVGWCSVPRGIFDITVIRKNPYTGEVSFLAKANRHWEHTAPDTLLAEKSAAAKCLETGEELFIPDKRKGAKKGIYHLSERDSRSKNDGSLFCRPVTVKIGAHEEKFLITFATYGQKVCDPADQHAREAANLLFREFAKRIELELMLLSIKEGRDYLVAQQKKNTKSKRNRKGK